MFKEYYKTIKYLASLNKMTEQKNYMRNRHKDGKFFLLRMQELAGRLNIDLKQFKFIHIAGTAGKGTTTAMLHNILNQAGKKVGSYYSPHPTTTIERIKVGTKFISPNAFVKLVDEIKPTVKLMAKNSNFGPPSYFEILLAVALEYFTQQKCEYVVLETGCGGEFDATNIIPQPLITAITNIGYDHTQLLGKTLTKIATTKAGIIKPNSIFITTEKRITLLKIFKRICQQKKAKFISIKPDKLNSLRNNILLANKIAQELKIKKKFISAGIKQTKLSCRFENIQNKPRVILDGAHNLDKIKTVFNKLKQIKFDKLYLIFTLNANKDIKGIINYLGKTLTTNFKNQEIKIILTKYLVKERHCAEPKIIKKLLLADFDNLNIKIETRPHLALKQALKKARQNDLILITGSFYLAGELRKNWINEKQLLKERAYTQFQLKNSSKS